MNITCVAMPNILQLFRGFLKKFDTSYAMDSYNFP